MSPSRGRSGGPLRVLAWPAFKTAADNPHEKLIYDRLIELGVDVREFSTARLARQQPAPDIWHMHFPEAFLKHRNPFKVLRRFIRLLLRLRIAQVRGVKVVWTAHNLHHDGAPHALLTPLYWRLFLARLDACIHLSEAGRQAAESRRRQIAGIPSYIVPHMHYRGRYPDDVTREQARARLGLPTNAKVAIFIGQLRPYKNVPRLIHAFRGIRDVDARLVVAGRQREPQLARAIQQAAAVDGRVTLHLDFVPDDALQIYFRAADLMVLPYRDMLNSGTVMLSLSFDCPVLVPDMGSFSELPAQVGEDWVRLYSGDLTAAALAQHLAAANERRLGVDLRRFGPQAVAQAMLVAYRQICRT